MVHSSKISLFLTVISCSCVMFSSAMMSTKELLQLARTSAAGITLPTPKEGATRRLASLSNYEFRQQVCNPFKSGFLSEAGPGATCSCSGPSRYSITCHAPNLGCATPDECGGDREVCEERTVVTEYKIVGNTLYLNDITLDSDFTGADYDGQRIRAWGIRSNQCEVIIKFNGTHYKCNDCTSCDDEDEISMDCSNVHGSSTTNGQCIDTETESNYGILTDLCVSDEILPTGGEISVTAFSGASSFGHLTMGVVAGIILVAALF